jgi:hypothetical protein
MRSRSSSGLVFAACALAAALLCPSLVDAAGSGVDGKGPRVRSVHGQPIAQFDRPVFIRVGHLAEFGNWRLREAPPLVIEVEGDVVIVPLEDGSLWIVFADDE